jgi:probable F420-dependent oxidoreductase
MSSSSDTGSIEVGLSLHRSDDVAGVAREFEELGYDYLTCGEHVSFNVPTSNSFISLAVAAGATSRIGLMNSIALVPLYPAALLAKLGAALDVASGGRFSLGVRVGGEIPREFEACGVPRNERGARTNEALDVIRRLWTEPTVTYEGRFNTLHDVGIEPHPVSAPHPPIWVSGRKEAAMRRTARYADGWLPYMYTPEQLAESYETIGRMRAEEGRGDEPVRGGLFIFACVHPDGAKAQDMAVKRLSKQYAQDFSSLVGKYALAGTPDEVVARLREYTSVGARTIVLSSACDTGYIDENHRLLAEEVVPAFRGPSS